MFIEFFIISYKSSISECLAVDNSLFTVRGGGKMPLVVKCIYQWV